MAQELMARLLAISDLHVAYPENRAFIEELRPQAAGDWLLLAGDVGELFAGIEWALSVLSRMTWYDGVRFVEASVGYPREWRRRAPRPGVPPPGVARQILPVPAGETPHGRRAGSDR